jgi:hypothetical protein
MKTLKQMLELYTPKPGDEKKFFDKHKVEKHKNLGGKATEDDKVFQATNVKAVDREKEHGYNPDGSDEKVYEQQAEKVASVKEGIEDRIEAAREKARAAGKTIKDKKPEEKKVRMVQGKSYGGSKQKDDKEDMNESKTSDALYKQHHVRVKDLLKKIGSAADMHKANVMQGNSHYSHVGDMNSFANQLQDLHDRMAMQGEYAAPISVREEAEQVEEKKLTPAEMKKREEVAKAIKRENPKMPMSKKMAIATATAKKVVEQKQPRTLKQILEAMHMVTLHVKPHPEKKSHHVVVKSSDTSRFEKGESVAATELEQGQDDGYLKIKHVKE